MLGTALVLSLLPLSAPNLTTATPTACREGRDLLTFGVEGRSALSRLKAVGVGVVAAVADVVVAVEAADGAGHHPGGGAAAPCHPAQRGRLAEREGRRRRLVLHRRRHGRRWHVAAAEEATLL